MGIRYYCDRCGRESPTGELAKIKLGLVGPRQPLEVIWCDQCLEHARATLRQAEVAAISPELVLVDPSLASVTLSRALVAVLEDLRQAAGAATGEPVLQPQQINP
jgi:hypothetical protein